MKAMVVGLGSIGRRHAANLRRLVPDAHITALRRPGAIGSGEPSVDRVVYSLQEALEDRPNIAVIASPATEHLQTARALADVGVDLLIEKPLAHSAEGVEALIDSCYRRHLVLQVGYNLRFNPSLLAFRRALVEGRIGRVLHFHAEVGQYLPDWRPNADYRFVASARRATGGGALLELSHEIDYALWLMGRVKQVSARLARLSDLDLDVEDTADLILEFETGAAGTIHLDMVQRVATRTCRAVGTEGTLTWDGISQQTRCFSVHDNAWFDLHVANRYERNDSYLDEMKSFLKCVAHRESPAVTGEDGLRALEVILAARQSAKAQCTVKL